MRYKRLISAIIIATLFVCTFGTSLSYGKTVKATEVTKHVVNGTTLSVGWKSVSDVDGYQIQYANNRFFNKAESVTVNDGEKTSKKIKKVSIKSPYVRIRAYTEDEDGNKTYSQWAHSSNCRMNKKASLTSIKKTSSKNSKKLELRKLSGQKMENFDTMQGGVAYGNTGWYIMYDRNKSKCKIAKINLKTKKLIKVSPELNISHGNDIAYNSNRKQLVVAHGAPNYKLVSFVDPDSLVIQKTVTLTLPKGTPGASDSNCSNFSGITAIAYNTNHKMYVARLKSQGHIVQYDENLNAVKYVRLDKKDNYLFQCMDSYSEYMLVGQSPGNGGKENIISVYNWDGKYMSRVSLGSTYELENVYHKNGNFYAGFYRSYYKTVYVDGFTIKVTYGKKNKVKTKLKKTKLLRDNYIYKITNL